MTLGGEVYEREGRGSAFKQLEAIVQAEEGTPEFAEMQAPATRIVVYERTHHPISTASAIDAIKFRMEQRTEACDMQDEYNLTKMPIRVCFWPPSATWHALAAGRKLPRTPG